MAFAPEYPTVVGTLSPAEAEMFGSDFSPSWDAIPPEQRQFSPEIIVLFNQQTEQRGIVLPETHSQFLPAVRIAVEHEKTMRGERRLKRAELTARQSIVQPGRSQQGGFGHGVHRDSELSDYFYTIADTHPTQYYPRLLPRRDICGILRIADEDLRQGVSFRPFDVVWAPTTMYHRSVPVDVATRRTFLRLMFYYNHLPLLG